MRLIANNKKAYFDYFVIDKYEAGIELKGTEVKSICLSNCSIKESLCKIVNGECFIYGMNIKTNEKGNIFNVDSLRIRRLLLHKSEILKINEKLKLQGYTLIPLQVYFKNGKIKIEIGLCKGKKLYDKREDIKKKDMKRDMAVSAKKSIK